MMRITKVVNAADDVHPRFKGMRFVYQGARPARQAIEALAKSSIEAFDKSGIDDTLALGFPDQIAHHLFTALNNVPGNVHLSIQVLLDDLNDGDIGPGYQMGSPLFAAPIWQNAPKRVAKGRDITGQAIHSQQQGPAKGHIPDFVGQGLDQIQITVRTDYPTQP